MQGGVPVPVRQSEKLGTSLPEGVGLGDAGRGDLDKAATTSAEPEL